ncbi:hypothetical protein SO802_032387 [Lithocarpus litseifolius]|uniref:Uncharacterized protein n=1 Tax=Lithocarpus litseifolius TaxID=425828 RepID=A0AAW2BN05_9ROSI
MGVLGMKWSLSGFGVLKLLSSHLQTNAAFMTLEPALMFDVVRRDWESYGSKRRNGVSEGPTGVEKYGPSLILNLNLQDGVDGEVSWKRGPTD